MKASLSVFILLGLLAVTTYAQVTEEWVARYTGPGAGSDRATSLAVDGYGNVYVTGYSTGNGTSLDYATIIYNAAGQQQWATRYNGPGNLVDSASSLAVDPSGNVYISGTSDAAISWTYYDYATLKYTTTGQQQWVTRYTNGPNQTEDKATSLDIDADGNVYVTGWSYGNGTSKDFATIKYNTTGQQQWVARYNGPPGSSIDEAYCLIVDADGNVYVTGKSNGGSGTSYDFATIKYNSAGAQQWVARYNGPGNNVDSPTGIAVDINGNVYVTGQSYGGSSTSYDYATIKYNGDGQVQWVVRYDGPDHNSDYAAGLRVDEVGNVYVTGRSYGINTYDDYATIKYDSTGVQQWVTRYTGPGYGDDRATCLALDESGSVYVTGYSARGATGDDYITLKYNAIGQQQWIAQYNGLGNGNDRAFSMDVDTVGNVYVTGESLGSDNYSDYVTIKYSQTPPVGTEIPAGSVSGDWYASGNPYHIHGDITVQSQTSLIIHEGVQVIFQGHYKLIVNGILDAIGTQQDSINFTSSDTATGWYGIRFTDASDSSHLAYCIIQHGRATGSYYEENASGGGIFCHNSNPVISHCLISNNWAYAYGAGISCNSGSNPRISQCAISSNFVSSGQGGGISCFDGSNAILENCFITINFALDAGAGIYLLQSSPSILNCQISGNWVSSTGLGAGITCFPGGGVGSNPTVQSCTIEQNSAYAGGGIYCSHSSPLIISNTIQGNIGQYGAGIRCSSYSSPIISGNSIISNVANSGLGGGIYCTQSNPQITKNVIVLNTAAMSGGGIYCENNSSPIIDGNTITQNAGSEGGGIYSTASSPIVRNCIIWNNNPQQIQIASGSAQVTYSDIQNGWPGIGNILVNPAFVDSSTGDYHLQSQQGSFHNGQWLADPQTSPCIDAGDPASAFANEPLPNGGRINLGFEGNTPEASKSVLLFMEINITPINPPIQIPRNGGSFQYNINVHNTSTIPQNMDIWIMMKQLPVGNWTGPYLSVNRTLGSGANPTRLRTQFISSGLGTGTYLYEGRVGDYPNTIWSFSNFTFEKLAVDDGGPWVVDFANTGLDLFDEFIPVMQVEIPTEYSLSQNYPNPFNPETTISFGLPMASRVNLSVYDISGRLVTTIVNGWREAGNHQVTYNGVGLTSGVYIYRLQAGEFTASGKMVMVK